MVEKILNPERLAYYRQKIDEKNKAKNEQIQNLNIKISELNKQIEEKDNEINRLKIECNNLREENTALKNRIAELEKERDKIIETRDNLANLNGYLIPHTAEVIKEDGQIYVKHNNYYWSCFNWYKDKRPICVDNLVRVGSLFGIAEYGCVRDLWHGYGGYVKCTYEPL